MSIPNRKSHDRSSGEAELHGIAAGMAKAMGVQLLRKNLGFHVGIRMQSDATPAIWLTRGPGMGKIRQVDVTDLWVQERIRPKAVDLVKVAEPRMRPTHEVR